MDLKKIASAMMFIIIISAIRLGDKPTFKDQKEREAFYASVAKQV